MTDMDMKFSFAQYVFDNNPTNIQVGYEGLNFQTGTAIAETEEYINIDGSTMNQDILDTIGESYVLKDYDAILTLKYNKTTGKLFDTREIVFQEFIEGYDKSVNEFIKIYNLKTGIPVESNRRIEMQYNKIKSPITVFNDTQTRTMFWIIPLKHCNI